jgi:hypothetical protein
MPNSNRQHLVLWAAALCALILGAVPLLFLFLGVLGNALTVVALCAILIAAQLLLGLPLWLLLKPDNSKPPRSSPPPSSMHQ